MLVWRTVLSCVARNAFARDRAVPADRVEHRREQPHHQRAREAAADVMDEKWSFVGHVVDYAATHRPDSIKRSRPG
jgi:hypothetical protein